MNIGAASGHRDHRASPFLDCNNLSGGFLQMIAAGGRKLRFPFGQAGGCGPGHARSAGSRIRFPYAFEILLSVDGDAVGPAGGLYDEDRNPVLQGAQLLEALDLLEGRDGQSGKDPETVARVRIDAQVLENAEVGRAVAGIGNQGSRRIERDPTGVGDYLDYAGIGECLFPKTSFL